MSLTLALNNALSGLQHSQIALQLTSNNVANVNTEGYSRKTVSTLTRLVAGVGAGVTTSDISRSVDENLLRDLRDQLSQVGVTRVTQDVYVRTQDFFGPPESSTSLTANIATLSERLESLATAPEDIAQRQQVVNAATALARQFNSMATEIQDLRGIADQDIADSVTILNTELAKIAELNQEISRNLARGLPTADLQDQRDLSLSKITEQLDVTYFVRPTGEVVIQTGAGVSMLDGPAPTITHTPTAGADASIAYPTNIDAITLNGVDITTSIRSGRLKGLIDIRDTLLPNLNVQLDTLAAQLRDEVNAIHNDGAGLPPPNTLTGTLDGLAGGDAFAGTGSVRIAVVDANGNAVAAPFDFDLTSAATVGAVASAIDTGLGAYGSASINANGQLEISAANASFGIVINEMTSDVTATSRGFSHHFGLNDFFVGDPAASSYAQQIGVRADIVASPALVSRGELGTGNIGAGDNAVAAGDNSVAQRLAELFTSDVSFSAAGALPALTTSFAEYAAQILATNATGAAEADESLKFREVLVQDLTFRMSSQSGVNIDEELAELVVLQSAYAASARVFSVASEMIQTLEDMAL